MYRDMKIFCVILPAIFLVSCRIEKKEEPASSSPVEVKEEKKKEEPASVNPEEDKKKEVAYDVKDADSLIGHKLDEITPALEAAEIKFRVVERDGEPLPATMDYLPERLNFKVKEGVVVGVTKG
jgi:hypothetical protein